MKEERVWEVLGQLGLRDVANSRVGSGEKRGISGGERRRLSIGLELVARPSILILDEPTCVSPIIYSVHSLTLDCAVPV